MASAGDPVAIGNESPCPFTTTELEYVDALNTVLDEQIAQIVRRNDEIAQEQAELRTREQHIRVEREQAPNRYHQSRLRSFILYIISKIQGQGYEKQFAVFRDPLPQQDGRTLIDVDVIRTRLEERQYGNLQDAQGDVNIMLDTFASLHRNDDTNYEHHASFAQRTRPLFSQKSYDSFCEHSRPLSAADANWLLRITQDLFTLDASTSFRQPVDERRDQAPRYNRVIDHPMDLGTIQAKLTRGEYATTRAFLDDFDLVISNAEFYNTPGSRVYKAVRALHEEFDRLFAGPRYDMRARGGGFALHQPVE